MQSIQDDDTSINVFHDPATVSVSPAVGAEWVYIRTRCKAHSGSFIFSPALLQKRGVCALVPSLSPSRSPFVMTASLHSSKATTTHPGEGHDPEALEKVDTTAEESDDNSSGKGPSPWEATLDKSEDPKTMATWRKWAIVLTLGSGSLCVTSASSMVGVGQYLRPNRT